MPCQRMEFVLRSCFDLLSVFVGKRDFLMFEWRTPLNNDDYNHYFRCWLVRDIDERFPFLRSSDLSIIIPERQLKVFNECCACWVTLSNDWKISLFVSYYNLHSFPLVNVHGFNESRTFVDKDNDTGNEIDHLDILNLFSRHGYIL